MKQSKEALEFLSEWMQEDFVPRKDMLSTVIINGQQVTAKNGLILLNLAIAGIYERFDFHHHFEWFKGGGMKVEKYYDILVENEPFCDDLDLLKDALECCKIEIEDLANIANFHTGNTISLYELGLLYAKDPRLLEISTADYETGFNSFADLERKINEEGSRFYDLMTEHTDTSWGRFCTAGCFNRKQISQIVVAIGPRPDAEGQIQMKPVFQNFLNGITSLQDRVIMAQASRKALIQSHMKVSSSGYLNNRLTKLCSEIRLSDSGMVDCGTNWLNSYYVHDEQFLKRLIRKWFWNPIAGKFEIISMKHHRYLVGQVIQTRSPIFCNCPDGICHACYGTLVSVVKDYNIGKSGVTNFTRIYTQLQLSAKHTLATSTPEIVWPESVTNVFELDGYKMTPQAVDGEVEFKISTKGRAIEFIIESLSVDDEPVPLSDSFVIKLAMDQDEIMPYQTTLNNFRLPLRDFANEALFHVYYLNDEVSHTLAEIENILDRKEHQGYSTPTEITQRIIELCCKSGVYVNATHLELIVRSLVHLKGTNEFPYWDINNPPDIEVGTIGTSIVNHSVATGLTFEKVQAQLKDVRTYKKRNQPTLTDSYFGG